MPPKDDRVEPGRGISPRTAALGLGLGVTAALGLALHPGPALAAAAGAPHATPAAFASRGDDPAPGRIAVQADEDDDPVGDDGAGPGEVLDDDTAPVDDGLADDEELLGDDDVEDEPDEAERTPVAVVLDERRRALAGPRAFAASRTARASGLRWSAWGAATTTARGRLVVKKAGPRSRTLKAAGRVVLARRTTCSDGTPLYRRATFVVGRRTVATVALPGCSARR